MTDYTLISLLMGIVVFLFMILVVLEQILKIAKHWLIEDEKKYQLWRRTGNK